RGPAEGRAGVGRRGLALRRLAAVRNAARDLILGGRRGRTRIRIAGGRIDDRAALRRAVRLGAILALGAAVVGDAADDVHAGHRHVRAGVRQAGVRGRDGAALRCAVRLGAVLALGATVVGDAARDLAVLDRVVGDRAGEHVVAVRVAHGQDRAARIEAEQLVVAARRAAEADAASAASRR